MPTDMSALARLMLVLALLAPASLAAQELTGGGGGTAAGTGGGISGPGATTPGFIPTWNSTTGAALGAGLAAPASSLVGTTDTQTLTGKTVSGASNTLTNI